MPMMCEFARRRSLVPAGLRRTPVRRVRAGLPSLGSHRRRCRMRLLYPNCSHPARSRRGRQHRRHLAYRLALVAAADVGQHRRIVGWLAEAFRPLIAPFAHLQTGVIIFSVAALACLWPGQCPRARAFFARLLARRRRDEPLISRLGVEEAGLAGAFDRPLGARHSRSGEVIV